MTIIRDPRNGDGVHLDGDSRMLTNSKSATIQNVISIEEEDVFSMNGRTSWVAATGKKNILHWENSSVNKNLIITSLSMSVITDLAIPNVNSFFTINSNGNYASGGSTVTGSNLNIDSAKTSTIIAYDNDPTLSGIEVFITDVHPEANGRFVPTQLSNILILKPSKTLTLSFTPAASHTGTAFAIVSFYFELPHT